jgi:hypothetical protein
LTELRERRKIHRSADRRELEDEEEHNIHTQEFFARVIVRVLSGSNEAVLENIVYCKVL